MQLRELREGGAAEQGVRRRELLRRLRQQSDLPVIFLTSKDEEIDEVLGLRMGADDYVRKPFSQRLLIERVRAACVLELVPSSAGRAAQACSSS